MKKAIITLIIFISLIIVPVITASAAAPPPPPPPPGGGGTDPIPIGGSAPVGSGLVLLLSMGAAYGAKKVYDARKKLEE